MTIDIGEEKRGELETVGTHGLNVAHKQIKADKIFKKILKNQLDLI